VKNDTIKILVFEDDTSLREAIVGLLSLGNNFTVAGQYEDGQDVLLQIKLKLPSIILTDLSMPFVSGLELIKMVRGQYPDLPIIVLTVFDNNQNVLDAIKAGASGYILKKHIPEKLITAIHEVLAGGAPMSPAVARMVVQSMQQKPATDYGLTAREKEILLSLTQGNSYKLIAAAFGLSIDTVRSHIKGIYTKLQVHSQTEATGKALRERLV
jgi:DNA-binding NarL/FixJ family response regulator